MKRRVAVSSAAAIGIATTGLAIGVFIADYAAASDAVARRARDDLDDTGLVAGDESADCRDVSAAPAA